MFRLLVLLSAHHVIITVKIPVTGKIPRIRILGRLDEAVVDLNHGGRIPQFSKLQNFRKIDIKTARGSEKKSGGSLPVLNKRRTVYR